MRPNPLISNGGSGIIHGRRDGKKNEAKMMRQPSYRKIPTVSDFKTHPSTLTASTAGDSSCTIDDDEEETSGLEASLDFDSFFEEEENSTNNTYGVCRGTYEYGLRRNKKLQQRSTLTSSSSSSSSSSNNNEEARDGSNSNDDCGKGRLIKGTFEDPSSLGGCEDFSTDANDEDDDLSYDSIDYIADDYDDDEGETIDDGTQINIFTASNRNISIMIDDLLKEDEFSDSSDEEEGFFIEEKPPKQPSGGKRSKKRRLVNSYHNRRYSDTIMLVDHYSLHTIDEEDSLLSDDCSRCSKKQVIVTSSTSPTVTAAAASTLRIDKPPSQFLRSQSAPTPPTHPSSNYYRPEKIQNCFLSMTPVQTNNHHPNKRSLHFISSEQDEEGPAYENNYDDQKLKELNLSYENLKCFSLGTTYKTPSTLSGASSNQHSNQADIECQEVGNCSRSSEILKRQYSIVPSSAEIKPYQIKRMIFVSALGTLVVVVLVVANSIS